MDWHVGHVIRNLRESVKWTLADLAHLTGLSPQVINRIERGHTREPKRATLDRIAVAFELPSHLELIAAIPRGTMPVFRPRSRSKAPRARHADTVVNIAVPRPSRKRRRA